jgi:signal transduction histidine kinase/CheY-like chemotaxis protein/putative methionine-R-sulfoxide reductase with GAF domain
VYANRLYATLSQVNQAIVRVKSRQELFESICSIAVEFGGFRLAWIGLFGHDSGVLTPVAVCGSGGINLPFEDINVKEMPFKEGLIGLALTSGQAQFSDDLMTDRWMLHWREIAKKNGYHSAAVIPIRQSGQIVGFLNLYAADARFFMVKEEQSLLEEIGSDVSFALDMMTTESERKRAESQIQHQLKRLQGLRAIDIAISSSFDLRVILDIVLQQVVLQLGVDAAAILLLNPHDQTMEYAASRGFHSNALHYTRLKLSEGYAGRAVRERLTVHIPGLLKAGGKLAEAMQSANEDFVDYYGTPLIAKGEPKGVLEIYHRSTLKSDPEWLDSLETLAGQAAIAIDNAQLFENLQHANTELEKRVAKRTEELSRMNIELEHASRTKDEFLATMSHELRTPLNSILGLSESLLEQRRNPLSEYQQTSLQIIESSGRHLLELINDILDLSKIEAGKFDYYPQFITVDELCRASLAFVKEQATRKSITLTYQEETAVSKIYADPRRLKQILVNLLINAVKFTPDHGQVILQVRADEEQDQIQFSVIDNGIGIALEDLQKLFVPFAQVDSSLTREHEGTGLGLSLVQKLTDLHGGSVNVESEVGRGSRFTINLPLGKGMVAQQEVIESGDELSRGRPKGKSNLRLKERLNHGIVLLAEDNMANILTIGDYLESNGYQIVVAHDGWETIAKAEEVNPDIIMTDIQMPVMDGLEATRRLRKNPRFATTPIIALTALAMPGDRERCLEAGANEYMSKPVSLKGLIKTIKDLLQR